MDIYAYVQGPIYIYIYIYILVLVLYLLNNSDGVRKITQIILFVNIKILQKLISEKTL